MEARSNAQFHTSDNHDSPNVYNVGDTLDGLLAWEAVKAGHAEWVTKPTKDEEASAEKALKDRPPREFDVTPPMVIRA